MSKHNKGGLVKVQEPISGKCYFYDFIPTGRIKRIRKGESVCNGILRRIHGTSIVIPRNDPNFYEQMLHKITRWTRH